MLNKNLHNECYRDLTDRYHENDRSMFISAAARSNTIAQERQVVSNAANTAWRRFICT